MKKRKWMNKFLAVLLSVLCLLGAIPFEFVGSIRANAVAPKDTFSLKKVADGTHDGEGTETFINSKNGYSIADDTIDDGVVASGDIVKYKFKLSVPAGPKRKLRLDFEQKKDGALELADFEKLSFGDSLIKAKWSKGGLNFYVPGGAVAETEGYFYIRAKDTKGEVNKNNVITAKLTSDVDENYNYSVKTEPVTVVSVPLADLTIDGKTQKYRSYTQKDSYGVFKIEPMNLHYEGYSKAGVTASTTWKTDVDVSGFPEGTKWEFNGENVPVEGGKLKDLSGEGDAELRYYLPEETINELGSERKVYELFLEPHEDSFKAGDSKNITDPGAGEIKTYDTSKHKVNGKLVHAVSGYMVENNNYGVAIWEYYSEPKEKVWRYDVYAPYDSMSGAFDEANIHWNKQKDWWTQGNNRHGYKHLTQDSDLYSKHTLKVGNLDEGLTSKIVLGDTWNVKGSNDKYETVKYNNRESVMVFADGVEVPFDNYTVQWRTVPIGTTSLDDNVSGAGQWIDSFVAPNNEVNQYRVIFEEEAFKTGKGAGDVFVFAPVKARNDYDEAKDNNKKIYSTGSFVINGQETSKAINNNEYKNIINEEVLNFPQTPQIEAGINCTNADELKMKKGVYTPIFRMNDLAKGLPALEGYSARRTLEFEDVFDVSTFKLLERSAWNVVSAKGNKVVLEKNNFDFKGNYSSYSLDDIYFSIDTVYNLNVEGNVIDANIKEKVDLTYPGVGTVKSGTVSDEDFTSIRLTTTTETSSMLYTEDRKREVGDMLDYMISINGDKTGFSQDIIMPYVGDAKDLWSKINKANNSDIQIDDATGKEKGDHGFDLIGRSKFDGDYTINSISLKEHAVGETTVTFTLKGKEYKLPVGDDGLVDVSSIKDIRLGKKDAAGAKITVSSTKPMSAKQSTGVLANIKLKPSDNKVGNDYVMWLDATDYIRKGEKVPSDVIAWPDYITIVDSSISGRVWADSNGDATIGPDEKGFAGVTVQLQKKNNKGEYENIGEPQKTDEYGDYKFTGLHSSQNYRVVLSEIERDPGNSDEILSINKNKAKDAKAGDLPLFTKNRFGVHEKTTQTYSYSNKKAKLANSIAEVSLGKDTNLENVNFGFQTHKSDIALDKSPAKVTKKAGYSEVEWSIKVKNTSNEPLSGVKLTDRMSDDVKNVKADVGYSEPVKQLKGDVVDIAGSMPVGYFQGDSFYTHRCSYWPGSLIATSEDIGVVNNDGEIEKIFRNEGTPLAVENRDPNSPLSIYSDFTTRVVAVLTDKKLFEIYKNGSTWEEGWKITNIASFSNPPEKYIMEDGSIIVDDDIYLKIIENDHDHLKRNIDRSYVKITGYEGTPISGRMNIFLTTEGVWIANTKNQPKGEYEVRKIDCGINKPTKVKGIAFDYIVASNNKAVILKDADKPTMKITEVQGLRGDIKEINGWNISSQGAVIGTTEGVYIVDAEGNSDKVRGIPASSKYKISGYSPSSSGVIVCTDQGAWLIDTDESVKKIEGISGKVINVSSDSPTKYGGSILTDKGAWLINPSGIATKIKGYKGTPFKMTGDSPYGERDQWGEGFGEKGALIATNEGAWLIGQNGRVKSSLPIGTIIKHVKSQDLQPVRRETKDNWTTREYELPTIAPGEEIEVLVSGVAYNKNKSYVVGNQAWVTSEVTPRGGLENTTGEGQPKGVPDIPTLPAPDKMNKDAIEGTKTVKTTFDIEDDIENNDLADQTPALIVADPKVEEGDDNYFLAGYAWFDNDEDGIRDENNPEDKPASGFKVRVVDLDLGVTKETVTDEKGYWEIGGLRKGGNYDVYYDLTDPNDKNKVWSSTQEGEWPKNKNSDIDKAGYVDRYYKNAFKTAEESIGECDAGLIYEEPTTTETNSMSVTKGIEGDDIDVIKGKASLKSKNTAPGITIEKWDGRTFGRIDDGDNDETTQAYTFVIKNNEEENFLTDIRLNDILLEGNKAIIGEDFKLIQKEEDPYGMPEKIILNENGYICDADYPDDPDYFGIAPGDMLVGTIHVPFTKNASVHKDKLEVSAILRDYYSFDDLGTITAEDTLTAKYEIPKSKTVKFNLLGVNNIDDKDKKKLEGAKFKVEKVKNYGETTDVKEYKYKTYGTYTTDKDGSFNARLGKGTYKVTELKTNTGYLLPTGGGWFVTIGDNEAGNTELSITTDNDMPYSFVKNAKEDDEQLWGEVTLHNIRAITLPETGGRTMWIYIISGAFLVLLGFYISKKKRDK